MSAKIINKKQTNMQEENKNKLDSTESLGRVKSETAMREEKILEFWHENKIFEKSLDKKSPKGEYVFYEGPPTANGKPGIHHLEARAFKDVIPRYKTMQGYHVRRKGGWDTHGLPVELQVEKKLGLNSKKAIEEYGIAKFNEECKESVWEYVDLWEKFTNRIGYWVDLKDPYVTYHNSYIESVWNILKKVDEQGLLYKDYKVVPWCPRCGTALSSHELAQGYEDVKDLSVYVKFKIKNPEKIGLPKNEDVYILAWTTTPWTLPGNVALAVGKDIEYVRVRTDLARNLILAKPRLSILDGTYEILNEFKGSDLVGLEYEPLYPFLSETISKSEKPKLEKAYKTYEADFVTTEDGTGVVHTAVMYGQDDFVLGTKIGLPKHHLVGLDGKFLPGTSIFEGRFVRDEEVAVDVIKDLAHRGLLLKKEKYEPSYPHCWRCHTALIYYARDSWYIKMSDPKIKNKMIEENKDINWEPEHIKEGRFGEWLKDIKDWAISRERYWGTPLPVWECTKCDKKEVIGSIEELKKKTKKSGNKYFLMRHGEAESNLENGTIRCRVEDEDHLTELGKKQCVQSAEKLKENKIDLIISSDFVRTKETAEIIKKEIGLKDDIHFDERLREINVGEFEGKKWSEYDEASSGCYDYNFSVSGGESWKQVRKRTFNLIYELEKKYQNKNILLVSHAGPLRLLSLSLESEKEKDIVEKINDEKNPIFKNAEVSLISFVPLSVNEDYELDLHRPFIDEVPVLCTNNEGGKICGGDMLRGKEVMDVWLDSGTMPFSEDHYPFAFEKGREKEGEKLMYPADFISEAIDQTRGWFYTLHAVGTIMGKGKAYKNVICLGLLLDAEGKKMSKSLGNVVDPWQMSDKYGVDTLRLWMYSVNQPGDSKNFDEKTVVLLHRQVFGLLYNVLAFYELYRDKSLEKNNLSNLQNKNLNILDQWILERLKELILVTTKGLENYKLLEPVRAMRDFIDDLSTWYLRRSRERIKNGDTEAKQTVYFVLKTLAKIMAPFAPFGSEDIWLKLKNENDEESVHLCTWPRENENFVENILKNIFKNKNVSTQSILEEMQKVREIVTLGLEARQKAGIKVKQPLQKIEVKNLNLEASFLELIKDELNVKEIIENKNIETEVMLDLQITETLKNEGDYRELLRAVQDLRKKIGLTPLDLVKLSIETDERGEKIVREFEADLKKVALLSEIKFEEVKEDEVKIGDMFFKIKIDK